MTMKKVYYDYCGWYRIVEHRNGTATVYHTLASDNQRVKVGDYISVASAKKGLSRYCGGMPNQLKSRRK